jgi:hypothetical protein
VRQFLHRLRNPEARDSQPPDSAEQESDAVTCDAKAADLDLVQGWCRGSTQNPAIALTPRRHAAQRSCSACRSAAAALRKLLIPKQTQPEAELPAQRVPSRIVPQLIRMDNATASPVHLSC